MKKIFAAFIISVLLFGCGPNNVEKANELIKLSSFDEAISILSKEIQNNPRNKAAHLALAWIPMCINQANTSIALDLILHRHSAIIY